MVRRIWLARLCLLAIVVWTGCSESTEPGRPSVAQQLAPTPAEIPATPTIAEHIAAPTTPPTIEPTPSPSPIIVVSPTPAPIPTVVVAPTPIGEATPPASAESAGPSVPAAPARPAEPSPPYQPQPLALHSFQPASGRARVVALDPGHGGPEVGAAGAGVAEKNVNLSIALKLRKLLENDGLQVVVTRDSDRRAYTLPESEMPSGYSATRLDVQTRIDIANRAGADVFVSIHNNGSEDTRLAGTEVWYDGKRPFAAFNKALADDVLSSLVKAIGAMGYPVTNRGLKEDSQYRTFQGRAYPIFVLGPPRTGTMTTRAGQMPAVLGETLFLSNPAEAAQLKRDEVQTAIAEGYRDGLRRYFQRIDEGTLAIPLEGFLPEKPNNYTTTPPPSGGGGR